MLAVISGFYRLLPLRVFTFGLLLFVEHHQVQGVVEVLGHLDDIVTRQSVCTVYGLVLQVGPIYTILDGVKTEKSTILVHTDIKHFTSLKSLTHNY